MVGSDLEISAKLAYVVFLNQKELAESEYSNSYQANQRGEHVATAWVDDMNDQSNETVRDAFRRARPFSLKPMSQPDSRAWRTTSHQCSFSLLCSEAASSVVLGKVIVISSSDEKIHDL